MKRNLHVLAFFPLIIVLFLAAPSFGAVVKHFKYGFTDRFGDSFYTGELDGREAERWSHYRAEVDAQGRIARLRRMTGGRTYGVTEYVYGGANARPDEVRFYDLEGRLRTVTAISRDAEGRRVRTETRDPGGKLSRVAVFRHGADSYEYDVLTPEGTRLTTTTAYLSGEGKVIRTRRVDSERVYYVFHYDPVTGRQTTAEKHTPGSVDTGKMFYDEYGNVLKRELYGKDNRMYGAQFYREGLLVEDHSYFADGGIGKHVHSFDKNFYATETVYYRREKFVIKFVFVRNEAGAVVKTLGYNSRGEVIAEYPDRMVRYIMRDGKAQDGRPSIVHAPPENW